MKRLLCFILMLGAGALRAQESGGGGEALPKSETRILRELQYKAFGRPKLDSAAPKGEAMLALAELGAFAAAPPSLPGMPEMPAPDMPPMPSPSLPAPSFSSPSSGSFGSQDYDALHALLERYRDDLLKLGLSSSELEAQLKTLNIRAEELKERLDKLKPKDGLKFHGRVYSAFSDQHLLGNAPLAGATAATITLMGPIVGKPAGVGLRYQAGLVHAEMTLTATRGMLSGLVQIDAVNGWGLGSADTGLRRAYLEMRLPVTLQVGTIDANLTPLTFWRNAFDDAFEPEPFAGRRRRLLKDMLMVDDKWTVPGLRASTEILFFDSFRLQLESLSAIVGNQDGSSPRYQFYSAAGGNQVLSTRFATYLEAFRLGVPIGQASKFSVNASHFWDVKATSPAVAFSTFQEMRSTTGSLALDVKKGIFKAQAEAAYAEFYPSVTLTVQPIQVSGTAIIYSAGIEGSLGHIKAFGRSVSSGFNSAGAQGRSEDAGYQFLGPFMNDNVFIGPDGRVGIDLPPAGSTTVPRIKMSYGSRFNDRFIPPGTYLSSAPTVTPIWRHLLDYGFRENIDPYGAATPNRAGFGLEGEGKFFKGGIRPKGSYESFAHVDALAPTISAYSFTRLRMGAILDLKPMLDWPLSFSGGYEANDARNGQKDALGRDFALTSTVLSAGAEFGFGENMGLQAGYRHIEGKGQTDRFFLGTVSGRTWDIYGLGFTWRPLDTLTFDVTYSQQTNGGETPNLAMEVDEGLARMTLEF